MDFIKETKDTILNTTYAQLNAYYEGIKEGVRMYSWMKDGVTYVGTCGWTLKEELAKIDAQRANRLETLRCNGQ